MEEPLRHVIWLGFALGLHHALDADHVIAVSTLICQHPGRRGVGRAAALGVAWGLGHSATLLLVGLLVLGLRLTIPSAVADGMEFLVGVMLVALGVTALRGYGRRQVHAHAHAHGEAGRHFHFHAHGQHDSHHHDHGQLVRALRRPALVGMVHGLAGSSALVLLALAAAPTTAAGLTYMALFAAGSTLGMLLVSTALALPVLLVAGRWQRLNRGIGLVAGAGSIALGLMIMGRFVVAIGVA